jgi:hypothetical protein
MSYRKNSVGFNTFLTENSAGLQNGAIVIGAYKEKDNVIFNSAGGNRTICITDGSLDGFIISGGTW